MFSQRKKDISQIFSARQFYVSSLNVYALLQKNEVGKYLIRDSSDLVEETR